MFKSANRFGYFSQLGGHLNEHFDSYVGISRSFLASRGACHVATFLNFFSQNCFCLSVSGKWIQQFIVFHLTFYTVTVRALHYQPCVHGLVTLHFIFSLMFDDFFVCYTEIFNIFTIDHKNIWILLFPFSSASAETHFISLFVVFS